tara:strand:+ start:204 stop:602 length:399 start_codon:yes stop_codon:yes gene_type:complete
MNLLFFLIFIIVLLKFYIPILENKDFDSELEKLLFFISMFFSIFIYLTIVNSFRSEKDKKVMKDRIKKSIVTSFTLLFGFHLYTDLGSKDIIIKMMPALTATSYYKKDFFDATIVSAPTIFLEIIKLLAMPV